MSSSRNSARSGTRGYAHLVEIEAPPARVWRALTDVGLIRIWSGADAEVDARSGGLYRIGRAGGPSRDAHIDIFEAQRRLRLIYMSVPSSPPCASAIVDDFLLDVRKGPNTTSLRLLGSGIPEDAAWDPLYKKMRMGWERNMARIKVALENPPRPKLPQREFGDRPLPGLDT